MDAASLEQSLPFRPWFTIWFHPCQTIQQIVDRNPWYGIYLLIPLSAIGSGIGNWLTAVISDADTFQENILLAVVYSLLLNTYSAFMSSLIMQWWMERSEQKIPYSHLVAAIYW